MINSLVKSLDELNKPRDNKVILLVGVPYSGKTWLAKKMGWYRDIEDGEDVVPAVVYLSFDQQIHHLANERGLDYNTAFKDLFPEAEALVKERYANAVRQSVETIVLDMTHLTQKSRRRKLVNIPAGYQKIAYVMPIPSAEDMQDRKIERENQFVPDGVVKSMTEIYEVPTLEEGFDQIVFMDNDVVLAKTETKPEKDNG